MDSHLNSVVEKRMEHTAKALRSNRMEAYCVADREKARQLVLSLIEPGSVVANGGSMTLQECGILDAVRAGDFRYLDRDAPGLDAEQRGGIYRQAFSADVYLGSCNAITQQGELLNVDGNGNRVAAYCFGPERVVLVAGVNKIVPDLQAAFSRLENTAAPANTARLGCQTPCANTGECMHCVSPARICCDYVIHRFQRIAGRIHVVLVGESLGY